MTQVTHSFAGRLIALIESHAEQLTQTSIDQLRNNPRTKSYRQLSPTELYKRVYDVYRDLGVWLLEKTDDAIQSRYNELGQRRFWEHIPLDEILWGMVLSKRHLRNYLAAWAPADSAVELYRLREFDNLVAQFFDRAMCYTAEGYEHARTEAESGSPRQGEPSRVERDTHGGWVL